MVLSKRISLRSGGQTGVDRATLDIAVALNIPYCGWCPSGGWAEDFASPPGLLSRYKYLTETPAPAPEQRTAWNVRDSDATLLLLEGGEANSKGTLFTKLCAELIFCRPCYKLDLSDANGIDIVHQWLNAQWYATVGKTRTNDFNLNIAGPRESECPGIYNISYHFLNSLLQNYP
jgi:hypothetical protein